VSYPRRRPRVDDRDGVAVHVVGEGIAARVSGPRRLPASFVIEVVFCGGAESRCARAVLGEIPYPPGWQAGDTVAMLPPFEAEQLPDGSWKLGPGYWADTPDRRRGPSIPLPAVAWCPRCGTRRLVKAEPVHHPRPQQWNSSAASRKM